jgi:hypothetical protein
MTMAIATQFPARRILAGFALSAVLALGFLAVAPISQAASFPPFSHAAAIQPRFWAHPAST